MTEASRFVSLFTAKIRHTLRYLDGLPRRVWQIRSDEDARTGTTVPELVAHLYTAEEHWFRAALGSEGPVLGRPPAPQQLPRSAHDVREAYRGVPELAARLAHAHPERPVVFAAQVIPALELGWLALAHHAFHLGHIDLLVRGMDLPAVRFQPWSTADDPSSAPENP